MAIISQAVDFVMRQEDASLEGEITNSLADRGGLTRFGLPARFHPELVDKGFFEPTMERLEALALAETTYADTYSGPLMLDQINNQAVATGILSFSVLEGNHEAVTVLQKSLVWLGAQIAIDGQLGPETLAAINAQDPAKLVEVLISYQKNFFASVAANAPSQAVWLHGWDNRADAIETLLAPVA